MLYFKNSRGSCIFYSHLNSSEETYLLYEYGQCVQQRLKCHSFQENIQQRNPVRMVQWVSVRTFTFNRIYTEEALQLEVFLELQQKYNDGHNKNPCPLECRFHRGWKSVCCYTVMTWHQCQTQQVPWNLYHLKDRKTYYKQDKHLKTLVHSIPVNHNKLQQEKDSQKRP